MLQQLRPCGGAVARRGSTAAPCGSSTRVELSNLGVDGLVGPMSETAWPGYEESMTDTGDGSSGIEPTASAGESGAATSVPESGFEVVVGEIPDAEDLTRMLWTARCTVHGLLGTYPDRVIAEAAREQHLVDEHTSR